MTPYDTIRYDTIPYDLQFESHQIEIELNN